MKCVPDIVYDPRNALALDLYLPANLKATACVVYMHGGGFQTGARDDEEVPHFAQALTDAGFAMASISYRLNTPLESFSETDQGYIEAYAARSKKARLTMSSQLYGAGFIAAMEDLSCALEYLWVEGEGLGIAQRKVGVIGMSAGGIAALALSYPPAHWVDRVLRPDAVVAISGALVQPWRADQNGPPCLLINAPRDTPGRATDAEIGVHRAEQKGAPVSLLNTNVPGHDAQLDVVLDGKTDQGEAYMQLVLDQFARLSDD